MPILQTLTDGTVPVHIYTRDIEAAALAQLKNLARLPIMHHHVAAMPDVHMGIGATVGAVIATDKAIIPAAVGVDIGCGMLATRLSLGARDLDEKTLQRVFDQISRDIPLGFAQHEPGQAPSGIARRFEHGYRQIVAAHPEVLKHVGRQSDWVRQLGTLGGGNHFIELCTDESGQLWIMLHSGSRGIGNAIGSYFIELARRDMERQQIRLPDRDLAYLQEGSAHFDAYVAAVHWAQDYARQNRECLLAAVVAALARHLPPFTLSAEAVNCHHNYVSREMHFGAQVWLTRKGAIRAGQGELGIIPGSMGAKSYIVRGKGNADSFDSCAHGAGRRMSRNAAHKRFTAADLERQTAGVVCRKDKGVVDEIPGAYKDIDSVMDNQNDLVEIVHTLKQLVCVKG